MALKNKTVQMQKKKDPIAEAKMLIEAEDQKLCEAGYAVLQKAIDDIKKMGLEAIPVGEFYGTNIVTGFKVVKFKTT